MLHQNPPLALFVEYQNTDVIEIGAQTLKSLCITLQWMTQHHHHHQQQQQQQQRKFPRSSSTSSSPRSSATISDPYLSSALQQHRLSTQSLPHFISSSTTTPSSSTQPGVVTPTNNFNLTPCRQQQQQQQQGVRHYRHYTSEQAAGALDAIRSGMPLRCVADTFGVPRRTASYWRKKLRQAGAFDSSQDGMLNPAAFDVTDLRFPGNEQSCEGQLHGSDSIVGEQQSQDPETQRLQDNDDQNDRTGQQRFSERDNIDTE